MSEEKGFTEFEEEDDLLNEFIFDQIEEVIDVEEDEDDQDDPIDEDDPDPNEEDEDDPNEEDDDSKKINVQTHYEVLKEEGLLMGIPEDYEFEGDLDEVLRMDAEARTIAVRQAVAESLPDEVKEIIQYGINLKKGDAKGIERLKEIVGLEVQLSDISEVTDQDGAVAEITRHYSEKGVPDKAIKSIITDLQDNNQVIEEGKRLNGVRKANFEKLKKQRIEEGIVKNKEAEAKQREFQVKIVDTIKNTKWKNEQKLKTGQALLNGSFQEKVKALLADPEQLPHFAALVSRVIDENGKLDMEALTAMAENKATKRMKKKWENKFSGTKAGGGTSKKRKDEEVNTGFESGYVYEIN